MTTIATSPTHSARLAPEANRVNSRNTRTEMSRDRAERSVTNPIRASPSRCACTASTPCRELTRACDLSPMATRSAA